MASLFKDADTKPHLPQVSSTFCDEEARVGKRRRVVSMFPSKRPLMCLPPTCAAHNIRGGVLVSCTKVTANKPGFMLLAALLPVTLEGSVDTAFEAETYF